jgi:hypothetical protein
VTRADLRPERLLPLEKLRALREETRRRALAAALARLNLARDNARAAAAAALRAQDDLRDSPATFVALAAGQPLPASALHGHAAAVAALREQVGLTQQQAEHTQEEVDHRRVEAEAARKRLDEARRAHARLSALHERIAELARRVDERLAELADDTPMQKTKRGRSCPH